MSRYPVYENPYEKVIIDNSTVLKLHRFAVGNPEVARYRSTLSPPSNKLEAYFKLFKVPYEVVPVMNTDDAPRGKVPYILINDVKLTDSPISSSTISRGHRSILMPA